MVTTTQITPRSITTKKGYVVTDPNSLLLTASEYGTLMARLERPLDSGATSQARAAYAAEEMRLACLP